MENAHPQRGQSLQTSPPSGLWSRLAKDQADSRSPQGWLREALARATFPNLMPIHDGGRRSVWEACPAPLRRCAGLSRELRLGCRGPGVAVEGRASPQVADQGDDGAPGDGEDRAAADGGAQQQAPQRLDDRRERLV